MKKWKVILFIVLIIFSLILPLLGEQDPLSLFSAGSDLYRFDTIAFILLILVSVFLPPILATQLFENDISKMHGIGRGLLKGGIISLVFNFLELIIVRPEGYGAIMNVSVGIISGIYLVIGGVVYLIWKKAQTSAQN
ncbi:MAG: hypothetical protein WCK90_02415 [archaeon]